MGRVAGRRLVLLALVALWPVSAGRADDPRLDPAAIQAWRDYEAFARSLQGASRRTTTSLISGTVRTYRTEYRQNTTSALIRTGFGDLDVEFCQITNPRYAAEIKRRPGGGDELLRKYDPDPLTILPSSALPVADALFVEMSPHYCYGQRQLTAVRADPNFKILGVTRVTQDGRDLVRVEFTSLTDIPGPVKQQSRRRGTLDLDPALGWCVRAVKESEEYFLKGTLDHKTDWDIKYEVDSHPSGFPVARRHTVLTSGFSNRLNKKTGARIEVEYDLTTDASVPDSEFTLSAFNLPEPIDRPAPRSGHLYLWVGLAAAACGGLAVLFRWLGRRGHTVRGDPTPSSLVT